MPRGGGHHVDRARFGIERETFPGLTGGSAESELAGGSERKTEYSVEVGLVAVPADADPDVILRAENLLNPRFWAAERLDPSNDDLVQSSRDRLGALQLPRRGVVSETERSDPPLALELAELTGLERKVADP
jgi:hypothetical protein